MATTRAGTGMIEWRCMGRQREPLRPVIGAGLLCIFQSGLSLSPFGLRFSRRQRALPPAVCGTTPAETHAGSHVNDGKLVGTRHHDVQSHRAMNIARPTGPPIVDRYRSRSRFVVRSRIASGSFSCSRSCSCSSAHGSRVTALVTRPGARRHSV